MSATSTGRSSIHRWRDGRLETLDYCDMTETELLAADSWLVVDGRVRGLELHRARFADAVRAQAPEVWTGGRELEAFWAAALDEIPDEGAWFPRVELQSRAGIPLHVLRVRDAPARSRSVVLASIEGPDPRRHPTVKGPDLARLALERTRAQARGADEAVVLSPEGWVVDGAHSALVWWRGDSLCLPAPELERTDSVTARSVLALAAALGVDVLWETARPAELDGLELWALSALHGARIVTGWVDGPTTAELPGRLSAWNARLEALRK